MCGRDELLPAQATMTYPEYLVSKSCHATSRNSLLLMCRRLGNPIDPLWALFFVIIMPVEVSSTSVLLLFWDSLQTTSQHADQSTSRPAISASRLTVTTPGRA